jgi:predicted signal transduction protein with EAL and GGDEF domain
MAVTELRLRNSFVGAGVGWFVVVFVAYRLLERPGLGIGHLYYVGIVLIAVAGGAYVGAAAGLVATGFYAVGVFWNPHIDVATLPSVATAIRLVSYVLVGSLIGYYAARSRRLLAHAADLTAELKILARRDVVTGLPNQRGFQMAITARIDGRRDFVLVVCQVAEPPAGVAGTDWLLRISERLTFSVVGTDVFRLSDHQFAVLAAPDVQRTPRSLTNAIEATLAEFSHPVAGWAEYPQDGDDALELFTAATERMYARAVARGEAAVVVPLRAAP